MSGIMSMLLGAKSAIAVAVDEFFNRVTLLLPGNGTNGAQNNTFLDSSTNNFTITRNGNTTQGTFSPFSQTGWSNYFNRTDFTNIYAASSADFNFGSGDFTIECFFNPSYVPASGDSTFTRLFDTGQITCFFFSGSIYLRNGAGSELVTVVAHGLSAGVWYHLAFVRSGTTYYIFRNGSQLTSGTGGTITSASAPFVIGTNTSYNQPLDGFVSDFRVTNGQALYTTTFTPATTPLTTTSQSATASNVKLLTCQSNRFVDNSTQSTKTILFGNNGANLGTRFVQAFSPFAPTAAYSAATVGGSGYFDGTGDYLSSTITAFGSGNFTIECWAYLTSSVASKGIFHVATSSALPSSVTGVALASGSSGGWTLYYNNGSQNTNTSLTASLNTWIHLAVVKSSTTIYVYVNGVLNQSQSDTANYTNQVAAIGGFFSTSYLMTGYMSGFKVTNTADYSGTSTTTPNFTLPTAPPSPTSSILCCNFTNAGITDATAKNVLETVGNVQISTTQSKFGGSSMYFDGTGDYLQVAPNPLFDLKTSDFTVEFWIYPTSFGSATYPLYSQFNRSTTNAFAFEINTSGTVFVYVTNAGGAAWSIINAGNIGTLTLNTWNHVAFVRNGSAFRGYVNGTQGSLSTNSSNTIETFNGFNIGATGAGTSGYFTGYIDDFRISRYARYTASFTAPTAAFPLQ